MNTMLKWCAAVSFGGGPTSLDDTAQGEVQITQAPRKPSFMALTNFTPRGEKTV